MFKALFSLFGVALMVIGGVVIWRHVGTPAVLLLEGCQGGSFAVPIGRGSGHCWGCYAAALGAASLILSAVLPEDRLSTWNVWVK